MVVVLVSSRKRECERVERKTRGKNTILRLGVGLNPVDGRLIDSSSRPHRPSPPPRGV